MARLARRGAPRTALILVGFVLPLGVAAAVTSRSADWSPWWLVLLLLALCATAELTGRASAPHVRMLEVSGSTMATFCAFVLLGPAPAACIAAVSVTAEGVWLRKPLDIILTNAGNYAAFAVAGGLLAVPLLGDGDLAVDTALAGIALYFVCDVISFSIALGMRYLSTRELRLVRGCIEQFVTLAPSTIASAMLSVLAVWTYRTGGGVALGLLGAALLLVQNLLGRLITVEFELRAERDRARAYLDSAGSLFLVLDSTLRIETVNRRALALLRADEASLIGSAWNDLLREEDRTRFADALRDAAAQPIRLESALVSAGGEVRVVLWSVAELQSARSSRQILLSGEDITERRRAESELEHLAFHDALTGLPNRTAFATALAHSCGRDTGLAVVFIDLDGFKAVNDALGHATGDELLRHASRRLESAVREHDLVARQSGDEFLVMLGDLPVAPSEARPLIDDVVDRLRSALGSPYQVGGKRLTLGASIGVAMYPADAEEPETLITLADREMYACKAGSAA